MKNKILLAFLVVVFLAACGTSPSTSGKASSQSPLSGMVQVTIINYSFTPDPITIKVGTTITWTNMDSVIHNVLADDRSWGSKDLNKGDSFSYTFTKIGTYNYRCGFHPNMKGTINVVS